MLTEKFNEAREQLKATREAAALAAEELEAAQADLAEARDHVRAVARSAWTGDRLGALQAMLTSESADELLDRVGTLQTIADHNNGVLGGAQQATADADRAKAAAEQLAAEAQAQVDRVTAQKNELDAQIAVYQAVYERLSEEEQRASRAAAERHALEQARRGSRGRTHRRDAPPAAAPPAGARPPPPPAAAVAGGSAAAQTAVSTAMAQIGDPYVWGAGGPNAFDCSGPDPVRLRGRRHQPAALQPDAVDDGGPGVPLRPAARRPAVLLQPGQPRRHVHRQRADGARLDVGRSGQDRVDRLHGQLQQRPPHRRLIRGGHQGPTWSALRTRPRRGGFTATPGPVVRAVPGHDAPKTDSAT